MTIFERKHGNERKELHTPMSLWHATNLKATLDTLGLGRFHLKVVDCKQKGRKMVTQCHQEIVSREQIHSYLGETTSCLDLS